MKLKRHQMTDEELSEAKFQMTMRFIVFFAMSLGISGMQGALCFLAGLVTSWFVLDTIRDIRQGKLPDLWWFFDGTEEHLPSGSELMNMTVGEREWLMWGEAASDPTKVELRKRVREYTEGLAT